MHAGTLGFVRVYRQADAESVQQTRFEIYFVISCDIWHDIRCKNYQQQQM